MIGFLFVILSLIFVSPTKIEKGIKFFKQGNILEANIVFNDILQSQESSTEEKLTACYFLLSYYLDIDNKDSCFATVKKCNTLISDNEIYFKYKILELETLLAYGNEEKALFLWNTSIKLSENSVYKNRALVLFYFFYKANDKLDFFENIFETKEEKLINLIGKYFTSPEVAKIEKKFKIDAITLEKINKLFSPAVKFFGTRDIESLKKSYPQLFYENKNVLIFLFPLTGKGSAIGNTLKNILTQYLSSKFPELKLQFSNINAKNFDQNIKLLISEEKPLAIVGPIGNKSNAMVNKTLKKLEINILKFPFITKVDSLLDINLFFSKDDMTTKLIESFYKVLKEDSLKLGLVCSNSSKCNTLEIKLSGEQSAEIIFNSRIDRKKFSEDPVLRIKKWLKFNTGKKEDFIYFNTLYLGVNKFDTLKILSILRFFDFCWSEQSCSTPKDEENNKRKITVFVNRSVVDENFVNNPQGLQNGVYFVDVVKYQNSEKNGNQTFEETNESQKPESFLNTEKFFLGAVQMLISAMLKDDVKNGYDLFLKFIDGFTFDNPFLSGEAKDKKVKYKYFLYQITDKQIKLIE